MSRVFFPNIAAYQQEWLDVGDGHQLYVEQAGKQNGIAVVYIHGGPGCGRSKPSPSISDNTPISFSR
jgi:proline iminopeptidase